VVGVAPAAANQAQTLLDRGHPFDLFLDPGHAIADAVDLGRQSRTSFLLNLKAWLRWLKGFIRTRRQWRLTGHYSNVPGVVIVDAEGVVRWIHRGRSIGDYPKMSEVLSAVDAVLATD
jgi:hypothetical protein